MNAPVIAERCKGPCGRFLGPSRFVRIGHVDICDDCYMRHREALALLSQGTPPKSCQNCQTSIEALKREHANGELAFSIHLLDGIYVALCPRCDAEVQRLTHHMYRDTPHGAGGL